VTPEERARELMAQIAEKAAEVGARPTKMVEIEIEGRRFLAVEYERVDGQTQE